MDRKVIPVKCPIHQYRNHSGSRNQNELKPSMVPDFPSIHYKPNNLVLKKEVFS